MGKSKQSNVDCSPEVLREFRRVVSPQGTADRKRIETVGVSVVRLSHAASTSKEILQKTAWHCGVVEEGSAKGGAPEKPDSEEEAEGVWKPEDAENQR